MQVPPKPLVSVVIPTYERPASLTRCMASLSRQEFPRELFEVIVVDDGSNPPVKGELATNIDVVLLRRSHQGVAAARAAGIAGARGQILAFLDDDCTIPPDYLAVIERTFRSRPETLVAQVGLDNPEPDNIYGLAWKFALQETLKVNLHPTPDGRLACGILGGVMVARREVFETVAYDPVLARSREDADLRYQLQTHKIPVYYEPEIRVFHHCRQTLKAALAQMAGYGRGQFHFRRKWGATPPPYRYVSLTSWRALRLLIRAHGVRRASAVYCFLWLRRQASLCGELYEAAACQFPRHRRLRWLRFMGLLLTAYVRRALWLPHAALTKTRTWLARAIPSART
jgi:glycosyltransferase involved in cell wall biosynthesis